MTYKQLCSEIALVIHLQNKKQVQIFEKLGKSSISEIASSVLFPQLPCLQQPEEKRYPFVAESRSRQTLTSQLLASTQRNLSSVPLLQPSLHDSPSQPLLQSAKHVQPHENAQCQIGHIQFPQLHFLRGAMSIPAQEIRHARRRRDSGLHRIYEQMQRYQRIIPNQCAYRPDGKWHVVEEFHPSVEREPSWRGDEELVTVGGDVPGPELGHE